jgi:hypothetical protein
MRDGADAWMRTGAAGGGVVTKQASIRVQWRGTCVKQNVRRLSGTPPTA